MLPNKPYLVRAFYEWICDSECTPYVVVDTTVDYVEVPEEFIENNQIVLNLTPSAIRDLVMDNRYLSFTAQFSGVIKNIYAPIASIVAVYAKENGRGMIFDANDEEEAGHPMLEPIPKGFKQASDSDDGDGSAGGSTSHLKIIK